MNAREDELRSLLHNPAFNEEHPHHPMSYDWYMEYKNNNAAIFEGGVSSWPSWFWDDVKYFRLWEEYERHLPKERRMIHETIDRLRN